MTESGHEDYALLLFGLAAMGFVLQFLIGLENTFGYFASTVLIMLASAVIVCAVIHYWRFK